MGLGYSFKCKKCGYELNILEGVGFNLMYDCQNEKAKLLDGKYGKKWQKIAMNIPDEYKKGFVPFDEDDELEEDREDEIKNEDFFGGIYVDFKGFICDSCKHISQKQRISIKTESGYVTMPIKCKKCKTELRPLTMLDLEKCPRCKEHGFYLKHSQICWD